MNPKKNLGLLTCVIFILLGVYSGCRGYEDGPLVSFRTVQQRLFHDWWIKSATVDGQEDAQNIYQYVGLPEGPIGFSFRRTYNDQIQLLVLSSNFGDWRGGSCVLRDSKQTLALSSYTRPGVAFPLKGDWNILRLTDDELIINRLDSAGQEWVLEMEGGEYNWYWD